jgi:hypothetical protein
MFQVHLRCTQQNLSTLEQNAIVTFIKIHYIVFWFPYQVNLTLDISILCI